VPEQGTVKGFFVCHAYRSLESRRLGNVGAFPDSTKALGRASTRVEEASSLAYARALASP